jgi:hypothetical protein
MKTLAVVIGNDNYHDSAKLDYAVKDAQGMADVFARLGYDVIHKTNISNEDCVDVLRELNSKIQNFDATIFFFAGHGFQFHGENYLTSVDCQIPPADEYNCKRNSILLSELLNIFKSNPDKINIVIIDACRRSFGRGTETTFAPVQAPKGTLIAFSTSPEEGAKDGGFGDYGIYTGALLQYIGREYLSVEELFKKVRRTVYNLTGGRQTPWEHTSLIGDFYFNTGQLVHSINIPYSEDVVKDANFKSTSDQFSQLITELRSYNWYRQNPAIIKLLTTTPASLDKNKQFILGRNLLQAAIGSANEATEFIKDLRNNARKYDDDGENHLLNGMLFEIYFNKHGEFRKDNFKSQLLEEVMALRKEPSVSKSFQFIASLLVPFQQVIPFWIPTNSDDLIDIDVQASNVKTKDWVGDEVAYDVISRVMLGTVDITDQLQRYEQTGRNGLALQKNAAHFLSAPKELVNINSNIPLKKIAFEQKQNPAELIV